MHLDFRLFCRRRFFPLFGTLVLGALNDNIFKNAFLIWFTYSAYKTSSFSVTFMLAMGSGLFILPFVLFSPFAGEVAEKYQKATLCRYIKCFEVLIALGIIAGFFLEYVPFLLGLLFFMGLQSTFFSPIKYSLLPEHLRPEELLAGNSFVAIGTYCAILLGTLLGGVLVSLPGFALYIGAVLIPCSLLGLAFSFFIPTAPVGDPALKLSWMLFSQWRDCLKQVTYVPGSMPFILLISYFWFIGALFLMALPDIIKNVFHANEHMTTISLFLFTCGISIGTFLCQVFLKGEVKSTLIPYGLAGLSFSIALLCLSGFATSSLGAQGNFPENIWLPVFLLSLGLIAISGGLFVTPIYALIQKRTPNQYIARLVAITNMITAFFIMMASVIAMLTTTLGYTFLHLLSICSVGTLIILILCLIFREKLTGA